jgi:hypothetical protein
MVLSVASTPALTAASTRICSVSDLAIVSPPQSIYALYHELYTKATHYQRKHISR